MISHDVSKFRRDNNDKALSDLCRAAGYWFYHSCLWYLFLTKMVHFSLLRIGRGPFQGSKRVQGLSQLFRAGTICPSIAPSSYYRLPCYASEISHFRAFSTNASPSNSSSYSPEEILDQCSGLYNSLTNINEKLGGVAIPKSSHIHTSMPFCLLVGNHSSGKSSFINYVLQRNIQKAGVAPTDDTFTVIAPGQEDTDADGPTLIGDPDLGFASLRQFGPTLIHHTQLKYRTSRLNFMLVG
jgi:hypothetical protein